MTSDLAALLNIETQEEPEEWLGIRELASRLGVSQKTIRVWIANRTGPPFYRFYVQVKYKKNDVDDWIEAQKSSARNESPKEVVTVVEASKIMGVHENTLWAWMGRGKGPPKYVFNGKYVFYREEVEKWITENRTNAR